MQHLRTLVLVMLSTLSMTCSGVQRIDVGGNGGVTPGGGWTVGVQVGITLAQAVAPVVQRALDARTDIPADVKARIDRGFLGAAPLLAAAQTALTTYEQTPTIANQCRVHYLVHQALDVLLDGVDAARAFGIPVDPSLATALGGLGVIDDILFPACGASSVPASGAPPTAQRAAPHDGLARVRAAITGRP